MIDNVCYVWLLFALLNGINAQDYKGCVINETVGMSMLAFATNGMMTPEICNSLAIGFQGFSVNQFQCYGTPSNWNASSFLNRSGCSASCTGSNLTCGVFNNSLAVYKSVLLSDSQGFISTGFFGVGPAISSRVHLPSPRGRLTHIHARIGGYIDYFSSTYSHQSHNYTIEGGSVNASDGSPRDINLEDPKVITNFKFHSRSPYGLEPGINGINITVDNFEPTEDFWSEASSSAFSVLPRSTLRFGSKFHLVAINITNNTRYVQQMAFVWDPKSPFKAEGCSEESGSEYNTLVITGIVHTTQNDSLTCSRQLTDILSFKQQNYSYVLISLLVVTLLLDMVVVSMSKFWWKDETAEYITLISSSIGLVEFIGQCLMAGSLSKNPDFKTEFVLCIGALVASSSINIAGNIIILRGASFGSWFSKNSSAYRFIYALFVGFCFVKGNVLSLLASRLAFQRTHLFSLPWSREIQLRYRILSLFDLLFGSVPQMIMIILLHNRLDEWTYLNILFLLIGAFGMIVIAWRATFELSCEKHGLDRNRNLTRWDASVHSTSSSSLGKANSDCI